MATAQQRGNPAPKAGALFLSFLKYLVEYPTTFFVSFSPDKIEVGTASPLLGHQRIEREDWRQEGPFFCFPASVDDAFIRLAVNLFVCSPSVLSSVHRSTNLLERISVATH